jgi:hypothetical protein
VGVEVGVDMGVGVRDMGGNGARCAVKDGKGRSEGRSERGGYIE